MAILRNVLVFLIALTVAGMLPAAHSRAATQKTDGMQSTPKGDADVVG
jgi:hypothetical protein